MAIIPVTKDDVESFAVVTTPRRSYSSSSLGVDGSIKVYQRASNLEKDVSTSSVFSDAAVKDVNFTDALSKITDSSRSLRKKGDPISGNIDKYLDLVSQSSVKKNKTMEIERFTPTSKITKYTVSKNNIKDMLMSYYKLDYPNANWAYTNYNSLNFFAASRSGYTLPTSSVLLYPNVPDPSLTAAGYVSGSYNLSSSFSFDFHINPRYKKDYIDGNHFKAGTIFHLSSSYALSLVTGSLKDENNLPQGFRLLLQLSQSANVAPSVAVKSGYPNDLIFLSDDNSLEWNKWHHVVVRWGTNSINEGTGSFIVDGINKGNFVIPSGNVNLLSQVGTPEPSVLCVGNFYEGTNNGISSQAFFFGKEPAKRDGLYELINDSPSDLYGPASYAFKHPLKAEVHDLSIRRYYVSNEEIKKSGSYGLGERSLVKEDVAFYVPPFFVEETNPRYFVGDHGGILQTPFFEIDGTTDDPFNVAMAFGVAGHYINLENFTKDFATGRFPRLFLLSGSTIDYTTEAAEANKFLYQDPSVAKRNLTILPCDDGKFDPNYTLLTFENAQNKFVDSNGVTNLEYINLDNLLSYQSLSGSGIGQYDPDLAAFLDYEKELFGPSPEQPGLIAGSATRNAYSAVSASLGENDFDRGIQRNVPLTIFKRTLDPSSNQVTIFNISNLYYGSRILPGSFQIRDEGISGSLGAISITLKDDGFGNLYRADSDTIHDTQNSVGNIFYDEGVVLIKSPHLYFFGKNQYEMSFKGVYNVYTTKYEILSPAGLLNSSSNATYLTNSSAIKPSSSVVDKDDFVYISGLYFHDENLNVVAKAKLAQPIIKRIGDKILFKCTMDF